MGSNTAGEMRPSGEITGRRVQTAEIDAAIAAAANTVSFARACSFQSSMDSSRQRSA